MIAFFLPPYVSSTVLCTYSLFWRDRSVLPSDRDINFMVTIRLLVRASECEEILMTTAHTFFLALPLHEPDHQSTGSLHGG